jgi:hypothetical protein
MKPVATTVGVACALAICAAYQRASLAAPECDDHWSGDWNVGSKGVAEGEGGGSEGGGSEGGGSEGGGSEGGGSEGGGHEPSPEKPLVEQPFGPINLILHDDGRTVTGTYTFSGKAPGKGAGVINGSLDHACGSTLTANWQDSTGSGTFEVSLQSGGASYDGSFTKVGAESRPFWGRHSPFACNGSFSSTPSTSGAYYITNFGCWVDAKGDAHSDPGDNCMPSPDCFEQAKAAGLCNPDDSGPDCEKRVNWYTADVARFGCLARLRITDPSTGKSVIAVALDNGPSCSAVENNAGHEVIDTSGRVTEYLFGGEKGWKERTPVQVEEVGVSTPLGPEQ